MLYIYFVSYYPEGGLSAYLLLPSLYIFQNQTERAEDVAIVRIEQMMVYLVSKGRHATVYRFCFVGCIYRWNLEVFISATVA